MTAARVSSNLRSRSVSMCFLCLCALPPY